MLRIQSRQLPHEHELVHAVHMAVWPASRLFFHEGLAVLLDNSGMIPYQWPAGTPLDPLLEADRSADLDYAQAWFLVSQIVADHGFEGLREFWFAVPPTASAAEIRETYQELFGQPLSALFEPEVWIPGEVEIPRHTCLFSICVGESIPWSGDTWSAPGVTGCEDDPQAVGPSVLNLTAPAWRPYVVELDEGPVRFTTSEGVGVSLRPCTLYCSSDVGATEGSLGGSSELEYDIYHWPGPVRVNVGRALESLPAASPGYFQIERL